ncbi:uncharacterized protein LOC131162332 [Malania oleifera]|uniref:uncharacterized protein LOC131162332 n=1 Tax=Malania oleifera TaxID=397392 RepID=UPI0025AE8FB3|nr:uncharacterized protein LOC131162332 [Malania oleifera]
MGFGFFLQFLPKIFNVLAWPSFSLLYPLYASIRAINSGSCSNNQKCLTFWVLFSVTAILELALSKLLEWIPFWPYVKGMATFLLVIRCFDGASFVYKHLRSYIYVNTQNCDILQSPKRKGLQEPNVFLNTAEGYIEENGPQELEKLIVCQRKFAVSASQVTSRKVQKEWSCPLCLVNATSEKCLRQHLQSKKHKVKEKEIKANELATITKVQKEWSCPLCLVNATSEKCLRQHLQSKKHKVKEKEIKANELATITKVQKEWSCPVCLVNATSEKCLRQHLQSKKHKVKEKEIKANELATITIVQPSEMLMRTNELVFLDKISQIVEFTQLIKWCRWEKPKFGWTKLNTDGSINCENAGFGGLLRDYQGDPICAYVSKAPRVDIFLVELWAVWRGLVLAWGLGVKVLWVESDSMSVVKTINREQPSSSKAGNCLKHIWQLLTKFEKYRVTHSWRETNRAADCLAKMDLMGNDVVLWPPDFPSCLRNIIKDDAQGKMYRRV